MPVVEKAVNGRLRFEVIHAVSAELSTERLVRIKELTKTQIKLSWSSVAKDNEAWEFYRFVVPHLGYSSEVAYRADHNLAIFRLSLSVVAADTIESAIAKFLNNEQLVLDRDLP